LFLLYCSGQFAPMQLVLHWSSNVCRSAEGRHGSWGGWFWIERDILGVRPFGNTMVYWRIFVLAYRTWPNMRHRISTTSPLICRHWHCSYNVAWPSLCGRGIPRSASGFSTDGRYPVFSFRSRQSSRTRVV